jgi:hypothetical protein
MKDNKALIAFLKKTECWVMNRDRTKHTLYDPPEGGTKTIGYGHKCSKDEEEKYGLSPLLLSFLVNSPHLFFSVLSSSLSLSPHLLCLLFLSPPSAPLLSSPPPLSPLPSSLSFLFFSWWDF